MRFKWRINDARVLGLGRPHVIQRRARLVARLGADVADASHQRNLIGIPARCIEIERAHLGDVHTEVPVHAGALDANKETEIY